MPPPLLLPLPPLLLQLPPLLLVGCCCRVVAAAGWVCLAVASGCCVC